MDVVRVRSTTPIHKGVTEMDEQNGLLLEINIEAENGAVFIHSKHVPGLNLVGPSFQAMKTTVGNAIKRLFLDNEKQNVRLIWVKEQGEPAMTHIAHVVVCPLPEAKVA